MRYLILFLYSFVGLTACTTETKVCTLSSVALAGTYKITALKIQPVSGSLIDTYIGWNICKKDDLYTFKATGILEYSEGVTSCDPASVDYSTNWSLLGSQITIGGSNGAIQGTISDFNCRSFKLIEKNDQGATITSTYSRQ